MPHLDDGLLNALLDHELDQAEAEAAEAHLASCPECRRLLEEIRALAGEADRLVGLIEVPPRRSAAAGSPATDARAAGRWQRWRTMAWAASVVLAAGLGWLAHGFPPATPPAELGEHTAARPMADEPSTAAAAAPPAPAPQVPAESKDASAQAKAEFRSQPPRGERPVTGGPVARQPLRERDVAPTPPAAEPGARLDGLADAAVTGKIAAPAAPAPQARLNQALESAAAGAAPGLGQDEFRPVEMVDAVKALAGSIRLVDGLDPKRILGGPGSRMAGADPSRQVIRVIYEDPPGRELWLDQQRADTEEKVGLAARAARLMPGDTTVTVGPGGLYRVTWFDQHGFRLALTGFLPADSLRAIIPRVH